ncbi:uncharacterized protein BP5553_04390 [Venustampulla echinocandica]|uniref:Uncharacterized protein n=1 Tax=Venustampulla echinocandica TaxID=2656787 RepID=A0A370TN59_9HELO|nr:uncharacterized protein BP5553_04390 [Venustampulla echinocandica]RDL36957.1 hypothetical protein BP5553_04390 [Venustampulla echinocandica]
MNPPGPAPDETEQSRDGIWSWRKQKLFAVLVLAAGIAIGTTQMPTIWRWVAGTYFYNVEYVLTASGNDLIEGLCTGVKFASDPWNTLVDSDWFKLQRCLGNEDGFRRQGELMLVFFEALWMCMRGFGKILGPLPSVVFIIFFVFYFLPWLYSRIERIGASLVYTRGPSHCCFLLIFFLAVMVIVWSLFPAKWFIMVMLLIILFLAFCPCICIGHRGRPCGAIIELTTPTAETARSAVHGASRPMGSAANLTNPTAKPMQEEAQRSTTGQLGAARANVNVLEEGNGRTSQASATQRVLPQPATNTSPQETQSNGAPIEGWDSSRIVIFALANSETSKPKLPQATANSNSGKVQGNTTPVNWWDSPRTGTFPLASNESDGAGLGGVTWGNARLLRELTELSSEMQTRVRAHELQVKGLEAQLKYAREQGNCTQVRNELDAARTQLRLHERDINSLQLLAEHLRQQLDNARNPNSQAFQSDGACVAKCRRLEEEKQHLLQANQEDNLMAQAVALRFGSPPEEAKHYTLKEYFLKIIHIVVGHIEAGGNVNPSGHPILKAIHNDVYEQRLWELTEYKNQLEGEVSRLGGDVQSTQLGLNPALPPPYRDLAYEDNMRLVFPIYRSLCQKVKYLEDLLDSENSGTMPPSAIGNPRSDFHDKLEHGVIRLVENRPAVSTNPKFEDSEMLLQSLLWDEISRLVNRGSQLCTFIETLPRGNSPLWGSKVDTPLREARQVCRDATMHILNDPRPLEKRTTSIENCRLAARVRRRFKIWCAMEEAIRALANAITSFNGTPPAWTTNPAQPQPSLVPKKSFESLTTALMKREINTLDHRIAQLLEFMENERLPGTNHGKTRIHGPPRYQEDWDALKAAKTFAVLARVHWYDECSPKAATQPKLPLDHPPLLHAVRRRKGKILVPQVPSFPWKLQKDGQLRGVAVAEAPDGADDGGPQSLVVVDEGAQVEWKLPRAGEDQRAVTGGSEKERKSRYWRNYNRVQQLIQCLQDPDPTIPTPTLWKLRSGQDVNMALVQAKESLLIEHVKNLEGQMLDSGLPLPGRPDEECDLYPSKQTS